MGGLAGHQVRIPYFFIGCFTAQAASDRNAQETSSTAAIAYSVCSSGTTERPSM